MNDMHVSEALEAYIARTALAPKTKADYAGFARHLARYIGSATVEDLETVKLRHLFGTEMPSDGLGATTIRRCFVLLRRVLEVAVQDGVLSRNPAAGIRVAAPIQREPMFPTVAEIRRVAQECDRHRLLVEVLGMSGMRIGEAIALRVEDYHAARGTLTISRSATEVEGRLFVGPTKNRQARTIPVVASLREPLVHAVAHGSRDELLFTADKGGWVRPGNLRRRVFIPAARRAGLAGLRLHDLRHGFAVNALRAGWNLHEVSRCLGHSSVAFTADLYLPRVPAIDSAKLEALDALTA